MKLLAAFFGLQFMLFPVAATALPPPPPMSLVMIACQVVETGERDDRTGWIGLDWRYVHAERQCKREVVPLQDAAEFAGAKPLPHNFADFTQCARAAMSYSADWNRMHPGWAVLKVGCPVPVVNGSGEIIGWHLPECPNGIKCRFDESLI